LIHNEANKFYGYGNAISKIFLGAKMSNSNKAAISHIIDQKKNKPKIIEVTISNTKYELEFEKELTYIPFND
jgi:c-di-AMP phosphodiesterase-like protein